MRQILASMLCLVVAACGSPPSVRPTERTVANQGAAVPKPDCLERISVDQGSSVLAEQRRVGPPADDFATGYPAEYLDPEAQVPVEVTRAYQIGKTPLLWWSQDKTHAVVNAAVLTDLTVADVTALPAGQQVKVGQLSELGVGAIGGRELVKFLIAARAIATYVHIGAELCLVEDHDDGARGYRARFTGEHTFFTNKKNVRPLAFAVAIDGDGVITVVGQ